MKKTILSFLILLVFSLQLFAQQVDNSYFGVKAGANYFHI